MDIIKFTVEERKRQGKSRRAIAKFLNISESTQWRFETKSLDLGFSKMETYLDYLGFKIIIVPKNLL